MFCHICGLENLQGRNFCKRCGEVLNPQALSNQTTKSSSPFVTAVFLLVICMITLAGFSLPMIALGELHDKLHQGALLFFATIILAAVVGIDAMLIRLFTKYLGLGKSQVPVPQPPVPRAKYNPSGQEYAQLPEPPYSVPSVTEHTTRNFDPVVEKRAKETS
jgi:hypothetical protein